MKEIEIPFGAKDSELKGWEYTIPEGMEAEIKDGKIVVREKESEDERIRKELVQFLTEIKNISEGGRDSWHVRKEDAKMCTDFLAYLEKQKYDRMKPVYDARESFESALAKAWNDYHNGYEKVDKLEDDYVECAHAKGFREGYLFGIEKQKEQKPAERFKEARGKYQVEWSEEDKRIITRLIDYFESFRIVGVTTKWEGLDIQEVITLLKSLRPSWKPSEKQMEALAYAIQVLAPRSAKASEELENLREQLKKLV